MKLSYKIEMFNFSQSKGLKITEQQSVIEGLNCQIQSLNGTSSQWF